MRIISNEKERLYLNMAFNKNKKEFYNLQDILDMLPRTVWSNKEKDEKSVLYELYFMPGLVLDNVSSWSVTYYIDNFYANSKKYPDVLTTFGSNEGLFDSALKCLIWVKENIVNDYVNIDILDKNNLYNSINDAIKIFNKLQK